MFTINNPPGSNTKLFLVSQMWEKVLKVMNVILFFNDWGLKMKIDADGN